VISPGRSAPAAQQSLALGRPPATTHAAIEEAAFVLFGQRGFEATTMDDIAMALDVGRRTLFRYYPSKNDILWGQFDDSLQRFEQFLEAVPRHVPVFEAVRRAILDFNHLDQDAVPQHRQRMRFLLTTPALLAHSELRYTAWRNVIAGYVAQRTGLDKTDLLPTAAGRVSLALSLAAYEEWLQGEEKSLPDLIAASFDALGALLSRESQQTPKADETGSSVDRSTDGGQSAPEGSQGRSRSLGTG
jgi:mycofactocin system transcriptional regulator